MIDTIHIAVCMKPVEGNFAQNALEHGVAGINVDGCRVSAKDEDLGDPARFYGADNSTRPEWHRPHMTDEVMKEKHRVSFERLQSLGRWPANVIHDGSEEVTEQFPETAPSKATKRGLQSDIRGNKYNDSDSLLPDSDTIRGHNDNGGSAARFFKQCEADDEVP